MSNADSYYHIFPIADKHTFRLELLDRYRDYYLLPPKLELLAAKRIALEVVYDWRIYRLVYLLEEREITPNCYVFLLVDPPKKEFPEVSAMRVPKKLYLSLSSAHSLGWESITIKTEKIKDGRARITI